MNVFLIGYDLDKPDQDYPKLFEAIKGLTGTWWHGLDSTWIVQTDMDAEAVANHLLKAVGRSDKFLVVPISAPWCCFGLPQDQINWLRGVVK